MSSNSESASKTWSAFPGDLHEAIRGRAKEIYIRNGCIPGRDVQNWMEAEEEILRESKEAHRRAVVIRVNGVAYVGEYSPESSDGYVPGEFATGDPIPVRFERDKMFVQRANGKELETTLVKQTG
jgi:Protein of unknown function (DUF2934)